MMQRREFLTVLGHTGLAALTAPLGALAQAPAMLQRRIPASGEGLSALGLGTWRSFDVFDEHYHRPERVRVLQRFFALGGALVDSSPMYGSSEKMLGYALEQIGGSPKLFAASKVWTYGRRRGLAQMEQSRQFWGIPRFDLMQVHNLLDWETHLPSLRAWKDEGRLRYIGLTTSHGRRHQELERLLKKERVDFVQFTYNLLDREAEQRLLPLAAERGIAVIINRPFQGGWLFERVRGKALPPWAAEFDCRHWSQFFLKFILAHPAVSCAIPATSKLAHLEQNMGAGLGRLPDARTRRRMISHLEAI